MSLASTIASAATSAQSTLAQLGGMAAGDGNTLLAGAKAKLTGVYSVSRVVFIPLAGGGYRKRTEVLLSITRSQLTTPPVFQTKLVRTDITPNITYVIDHIDTQNSLSWIFTLVSFAG